MMTHVGWFSIWWLKYRILLGPFPQDSSHAKELFNQPSNGNVVKDPPAHMEPPKTRSLLKESSRIQFHVSGWEGNVGLFGGLFFKTGKQHSMRANICQVGFPLNIHVNTSMFTHNNGAHFCSAEGILPLFY